MGRLGIAIRPRRLIRDAGAPALLLALLLAAPVSAAPRPPDAAALMADVRRLAAPDMEGRAAGSAGGERAARLIAAALGDAGLAPAGDDGTFFQWLALPGGGRAANVVGLLPGRDPRLGREAVVVGAHHDHEGMPGGVLHPGADDNASGCAVALGLARAFAAAGGAPRALVFAFFTAEEVGLLGSRRYVERPAVPLERTVAMVNVDMVGRLGDAPLAVLGADTGAGLAAGIRSAARQSAVPVTLRSALWLPSDHLRFDRARVPVVALFTGQHADQHRPGDTPDRVDARGLERVASLAVALVDRLATEPPPPHGAAGRRPPLAGIALSLALVPATLATLGATAGARPETFAPWAAAWTAAVLAVATTTEVVLALADVAADVLEPLAFAGALSLPLVTWAGGRVTGLARRSKVAGSLTAGALAASAASLALADPASRRALAVVDDAALPIVPVTVALVVAAGAWLGWGRGLYSPR